MIELQNISKSFGAVPAVDGISVTVGNGEIFGIVGPNGAGKTTTIRMMTGLLTPDSGSVRINGHDIAADPVKAKSEMGYVPDKAFLYEKLTAREILIFTAALYGMDKSAAVVKMNALLELFGIRDVEDELIEGFSQGMKQRLVFSAALIHSPSALLIDEPFVGLDPFGVRMLKEVIRSLGRGGTSIFLATHSLHIAEELCDRIGFIKKGSLTSIKNSDEIRSVEGGLESLFMQLNG